MRHSYRLCVRVRRADFYFCTLIFGSQIELLLQFTFTISMRVWTIKIISHTYVEGKIYSVTFGSLGFLPHSSMSDAWSGDTRSESSNYCFSAKALCQSVLALDVLCIKWFTIGRVWLQIQFHSWWITALIHWWTVCIKLVMKAIRTLHVNTQCQRKQIGANCQGRNHFDIPLSNY